MNNRLVSVLFAALAANSVAAESPSILCNRTSAEANGTFFVSYNPHVGQGPQAGQENTSGQTLDVAVGLTLTQNFADDQVEYSLWYDTNGANYKNDSQLGYDVCAVSWSPTPESTQIRGQHGNGTCYDMFSYECITAIEAAAEQYALQFYQSVAGGGSSSSSTASPPTLICGDIATSLNSNLPQECRQYVNSSTSFAPAIPITGEGSAVYAFNCPMTGEQNGTESTYELFQTKHTQYSREAYSAYADYVWPLLAIWMPYSGNSPYTIKNASAGMVCGRITNYTEDSYVPAPLSSSASTSSTVTSTPSASSKSSSSVLSGGAIAGIVVGVVVGVALLVGALAWFLLRRRKSKKAENQIFEKDGEETLHEAPTNESGSPLTTVKTVGSLSEAPDTAIQELPPDADVTWAKTQELNADKEHEVFELPGELHGVDFHGLDVDRRSIVSSLSSPQTERSDETLGGNGARRLSDVEE